MPHHHFSDGHFAPRIWARFPKTLREYLAQNPDCVSQRFERYSLRAQGGEAHISEAEKAELETIMKLLSRLDDIDKKMAVPGELPQPSDRTVLCVGDPLVCETQSSRLRTHLSESLAIQRFQHLFTVQSL